MVGKHTPPGDDIAEVSLFGPGYGESIVLHAGAGDWLIIDSCVDSTGRPTSITYLESLGVDPAVAVKLVLATHWHDDHVRGLAETVKACPNARFACSVALKAEEFKALVSMIGLAEGARSGVREFYEIQETLLERKAGSGSGPKWALTDRLLWSRTATKSVCAVKVTPLSPSDDEVTLALRALGKLQPSAGARRKRVVVSGPNHASVVLWVQIGTKLLLLGADLEETGHPGTGWSVIVDNSCRPPGLASVYKVAHHGSRNADQPRVWDDMLIEKVNALLTPFALAGIKLPTTADTSRICKRTTNAYITAPRQVKKPKKREGAVEKSIKSVVGSLRVVSGPVGHVRMRGLVSDPHGWEIALDGGATKLCA